MISIIVPLYNKETTILTALSSIQNQTYKEWECLIIDDGSTDEGAKVVQDFIKDDARFVYYYKHNGGPSSARNYGVENAKSDWIVFLDADDRFEIDALAHFSDLVRTHKGFKVYCCNYYIEQNGKRSLSKRKYIDGIIRNNFRSWYFGHIMLNQGSVMYQRELLLKHPLNETLRRFEDACRSFEIMRYERLYSSSKAVFTYIRDNSVASGVRKNFQEDFFAHLQPKGKPFWEQMVLYHYYKASFTLYGEQAQRTYPQSPFNSLTELVIKLMVKWIRVKQCFLHNCTVTHNS